AIPAQAMDTPPSSREAPQPETASPGSGSATPVDEPPMVLLFAIAAGGVIGGRYLAKRKKKKNDRDA
ncbi:MAG: hypothetical protein RLN87_14275, partial [Parasphingopyxis sp.]